MCWCFFWREANRKTLRKTLGARREPTTNSTHMRHGAGIETEPHWLEANALIPALPCCPELSSYKMFVSFFSFFTIWKGFWNYKSSFVTTKCHVRWKKLPGFNAFLLTCIWRQESTILPAYMLIPIGSQFKFHAAPAVYKISLLLN